MDAFQLAYEAFSDRFMSTEEQDAFCEHLLEVGATSNAAVELEMRKQLDKILPGRLVTICGMQARSDLNDRDGTVVDVADDEGCFPVALEPEHVVVQITAENLMPPPVQNTGEGGEAGTASSGSGYSSGPVSADPGDLYQQLSSHYAGSSLADHEEMRSLLTELKLAAACEPLPSDAVQPPGSDVSGPDAPVPPSDPTKWDPDEDVESGLTMSTQATAEKA